MSQSPELALSEKASIILGDLGNFPPQLLEEENITQLARESHDHFRSRSTETDYLPPELVAILESAIDKLVDRFEEAGSNHISDTLLREVLDEFLPVGIVSQMHRLLNLGHTIHGLVKDLYDASHGLGAWDTEDEKYKETEAKAINAMASNILDSLVKLPHGLKLFDALTDIEESLPEESLEILGDLASNAPRGDLAIKSILAFQLERLGGDPLKKMHGTMALLATCTKVLARSTAHCLIRTIGKEKIAAAFMEAYDIKDAHVRFHESGSGNYNMTIDHENLDDKPSPVADGRKQFIARLNDLLPSGAYFSISDNTKVSMHACFTMIGVNFSPKEKAEGAAVAAAN